VLLSYKNLRLSTSWCDVIIDVTDVFYQGFTLTRQRWPERSSMVTGEEDWRDGKLFAGRTRHVCTTRHGVSWSFLWGKGWLHVIEEKAKINACGEQCSRNLTSLIRNHRTLLSWRFRISCLMQQSAKLFIGFCKRLNACESAGDAHFEHSISHHHHHHHHVYCIKIMNNHWTNVSTCMQCNDIKWSYESLLKTCPTFSVEDL